MHNELTFGQYSCESCLLYGAAGCPLFWGCLSILHTFCLLLELRAHKGYNPNTVVKLQGGMGQGSATEVTHLRLNQPPVVLSVAMYYTSGTECLSCTPWHCDGWWLFSCRGSVAEHWRLKPEVSWVQLLATAGLLLSIFATKHLISNMGQDAVSSYRHISGVVSAKCYSGISFCESKKTVTIEKDDHKRTYMSSTHNSAIWNHAPVNRSVDDHVQTTN